MRVRSQGGQSLPDRTQWKPGDQPSFSQVACLLHAAYLDFSLLHLPKALWKFWKFLGSQVLVMGDLASLPTIYRAPGGRDWILYTFECVLLKTETAQGTSTK